MPECQCCGAFNRSVICATCRAVRKTAEQRIRSREIRIFYHRSEILRLEKEIERVRSISGIEVVPVERPRGVLAKSVPAIVERIRAGQTLSEVGATFGVSRERVRQVLARDGIRARDIKPPAPKAPHSVRSPEQEAQWRTEKVARSVRRLWDHVDRRGADECWNWTGACHNTLGKRGVHMTPGYTTYPTLTPGEKMRRTQPARIVWLSERGDIPPGHYISFACGNRMCCNPAHLICVTPSESAMRTRAKYGPIAHLPRAKEAIAV